MPAFPPTIILRHRKENLKKCSLKGLENRADLKFYSYPWAMPQPDLNPYVVLTLDGPVLSQNDCNKGIFLIDGTWRYATKMLHSLQRPFETRSLPATLQTAYPRRQDDCPDPHRGLASIEALYVCYLILGRNTEGLLDHYHWKGCFLANAQLAFPIANELH